MTTTRLFPILFVALAGGCGGDDGDGSALPDAGPRVDAGPDLANAGEVKLSEVRGRYGTFAHARAQFVDGVLPNWHDLEAEQGDCRLWRFNPAQCDEWCGGVCVDTNVCQPWPTYVSAGMLTFSGVKGHVNLRFDPSYGYATAAVPPADIFDDGATVTLSAAGATVPAFSLGVTAPATLETNLASGEVDMPNGQDFEVIWTPAGSGRVRLTLNSNNRGHGHPFDAIIVCDVDDIGRLTVPRALVEAFPETMAWEACAGSDCPPSSLMRYARATLPAGDGSSEIEFFVASEVLFGVNHP